MADEWKKDLAANNALLAVLRVRHQGLVDEISEPSLDAALSSDDPLAALRDLARADKMREVLNMAISRVVSVQSALKSRERTLRRNEQTRRRVLNRRK